MPTRTWPFPPGIHRIDKTLGPVLGMVVGPATSRFWAFQLTSSGLLPRWHSLASPNLYRNSTMAMLEIQAYSRPAMPSTSTGRLTAGERRPTSIERIPIGFCETCMVHSIATTVCRSTPYYNSHPRLPLYWSRRSCMQNTSSRVGALPFRCILLATLTFLTLWLLLQPILMAHILSGPNMATRRRFSSLAELSSYRRPLAMTSLSTICFCLRSLASLHIMESLFEDQPMLFLFPLTGPLSRFLLHHVLGFPNRSLGLATLPFSGSSLESGARRIQS